MVNVHENLKLQLRDLDLFTISTLASVMDNIVKQRERQRRKRDHMKRETEDMKGTDSTLSSGGEEYYSDDVDLLSDSLYHSSGSEQYSGG